jgi:hypothetical protein
VLVSAKIGIPALENFKLFYEEIINIKPVKNRIRRIRQTVVSDAEKQIENPALQ